ncbi:hypothetical protein BRARA_D02612 [Brassica rapa]|uniref:Defensin-like domain-containing protein n=4 Tax=Brassica TaxID=3705 RepID=A0A397ZQM7_BRACM|nr:hypothetical protein IGI04_017036 [Brassica rapa subsp. trilocularis]RID67535.1 hypothetical protein BRARA_D02612 [Brassica rapa]CAG7908481.1 unnamed protein product [Brassica rapa]VDD16158.1 unnamed protein product [Brassica oleracea]
MDIRKPSITFFFVITLVTSLSSYNTLAASVINSANGDVCDVPCVPGKYELFECAHDCMVDGFSTGYCDKKSQKCCCTNKGI